LLLVSPGFIFISVPLFLACFVLSIIAMAKHHVASGIIMMILVFTAPPICILGVFAIAVSKGVQKVEEDKRAAIASQVAALPNTTPQSVEVRRAEPVTTPTINPPENSVEIPSQRTLNGERYPQTRQRLLTLDNIKGLSAAEVRSRSMRFMRAMERHS
jgi:hypothetical protein